MSHTPEPSFRDQLRPAIRGVLVLTLLTGEIFSLLLFAITQSLFPNQAKGSDNATFGLLVSGTILWVGALCFFPALALGPIMEFLRH